MKKKQKSIEDEVDEIRQQIYEKTKHMTPAEHIEYYINSGKATARKYGFKLYNNAIEKKVVFDPAVD